MNLIFFQFQAFLHFLQLMDGFRTLTDLIRQVRDLLCGGQSVVRDILISYKKGAGTLEVLVFPLDSLQVVQAFLIGVLQFEQLRAQTARLFLRGLEL